MDKVAFDFLVQEVFTMIQTKYRFMERRWWMIQGGKWTRWGAREGLVGHIMAIAENTSAPDHLKQKVRTDGGKMYVNDRVIGRLGSMLHAWDGLPAREEPYSATK